jgi:formate dehydrogenase subunit gamma
LVVGGPVPVDLSAVQEMQYAQLWHTIVAFAMIVVIIGHIYIGTIGMEGAFEAMGSGRVDRNWAEEHHSLWAAEQEQRERRHDARAVATPAE